MWGSTHVRAPYTEGLNTHKGPTDGGRSFPHICYFKHAISSGRAAVGRYCSLDLRGVTVEPFDATPYFATAGGQTFRESEMAIFLYSGSV